MVQQAAANRSARTGFTLVELLIVALVIAILATIVIGAYTNALELAKEARTRAQISKLNSLIAGDWEEYRTRRVNIVPVADRSVNARNRLTALRNLMQLEFPDRKSDVINGYAPEALPARALWYRTEAERLAGGTGAPNWTTRYQNAECLYLIVASSVDREKNGLEFFRETEIGDLDNDGMFELLDGWGNPIRFLRWAAGFVSDKQQAFQEIDQSVSDGKVVVTYRLQKTLRTDATEQWIDLNPDPFDPLRVDLVQLSGGDQSGEGYEDENGEPMWMHRFYLYPLVISSGADGIFDIRFTFEGTDTTEYADPYFGVPSAVDTSDGSRHKIVLTSNASAPLGLYQDQGEVLQGPLAKPNGERNDMDNIHNHFESVRIR